jgi:hypothetical protein
MNALRFFVSWRFCVKKMIVQNSPCQTQSTRVSVRGSPDGEIDLWQFERHDNVNIALLRKQLGLVRVSLCVAGDLYEHGVYCLDGCG